MSNAYQLAGNIAGALLPAERAMNKAAIDLFAVGTAMFEARNSGEFHPLESQKAVERVGAATSKLIEAIGDIARAHDEFRKTAEKHQFLDYGELCPWPSADAGHGNGDNVVELVAAA